MRAAVGGPLFRTLPSDVLRMLAETLARSETGHVQATEPGRRGGPAAPPLLPWQRSLVLEAVERTAEGVHGLRAETATRVLSGDEVSASDFVTWERLNQVLFRLHELRGWLVARLWAEQTPSRPAGLPPTPNRAPDRKSPR